MRSGFFLLWTLVTDLSWRVCNFLTNTNQCSPISNLGYLLRSSARVWEDVLERSKSELGTVISVESPLVRNRGISIEVLMSLLFLL